MSGLGHISGTGQLLCLWYTRTATHRDKLLLCVYSALLRYHSQLRGPFCLLLMVWGVLVINHTRSHSNTGKGHPEVGNAIPDV